MVPISFENITRAATLDALNSIQVSETARATHESFESHLQRATATTLERSTQPAAPPQESRHEVEDYRTNEPNRDEPVRQESDNARNDDVDTRNEEPNDVAPSPETQSHQENEEEQHEPDASDEVVSSDEAEQQRATIQQIEVTVTDDTTDDDAAQETNALVDSALDGEESEQQSDKTAKIDETFNLDDETSAETTTTSNEQDDDQTNRAANITSDESTVTSRSGQTEEDLVAAQRLAQQTQGEATDTSADGEQVAATTITSRKPDRTELAATETTTATNNNANKALEAALTAATSDKDGDREGQSRNQQNIPQAPQAIANANQADSTIENGGAPSRFAQHLLARTSDPNARSLNITDADQTRFIDRVARAIQATGDRGGTLRLRLSPPELGSLTLEVKVQGGAVSARVEADTPAARTLLLENLPVLRERLAEQGMRVDQFDVDLTDRHTGGTPDDLQQNDQRQEDRPQGETQTHESEEAAPTSTNETPTTSDSEQLNIIV